MSKLDQSNFEFEFVFNIIAAEVHLTAKTKGWWESDRSDVEAIALMHSELSEALEAYRTGNEPSKKIPEFSQAEEEYADVTIRIMDLAAKRGFNVGGAIVAKAQYNQGREYKHGKQF